ncbi:MAG: MFS transporter [Candidatus Krumholzibacteriota bacterium]|nr:MFS transporter [Candidatus Krumholzibacteriota bacterium]
MSLIRELKALPRTAWILFGGALVNRFGSFVLVFLVLYLKDSGYSVTQAGLTMSAYGVGAVGAAAVGGYLADTFGRRNTIVLSMALSAVGMLALSRADSLASFIALAIVAGATSELYRPAGAALLTDITRADQRVTAFAAYRLAINLGMAIGPAVGGLLAEHSFFYLFVGDAVTSAAFGLVALFALSNTTAPHERTITGDSGTGAIFRDRYFMIFLIAATLGAFVYMQALTGYPLQIDAYGFSAKIYGLLISVNGFLVMAIELPITQITRRHNPQSVMFIGFVLVAIGFAMTGFVSSLALLIVSVVIWTMGEIIMVPVAAAHVANIAPAHMRGRYQGAFGMTWGIGGVLAPILGALLFAWNAQMLWVICGIVCLIGGVLVGTGKPGKRGESVEREPD